MSIKLKKKGKPILSGEPVVEPLTPQAVNDLVKEAKKLFQVGTLSSGPKLENLREMELNQLAAQFLKQRLTTSAVIDEQKMMAIGMLLERFPSLSVTQQLDVIRALEEISRRDATRLAGDGISRPGATEGGNPLSVLLNINNQPGQPSDHSLARHLNPNAFSTLNSIMQAVEQVVTSKARVVDVGSNDRAAKKK